MIKVLQLLEPEYYTKTKFRQDNMSGDIAFPDGKFNSREEKFIAAPLAALYRRVYTIENSLDISNSALQ